MGKDSSATQLKKKWKLDGKQIPKRKTVCIRLSLTGCGGLLVCENFIAEQKAPTSRRFVWLRLVQLASFENCCTSTVEHLNHIVNIVYFIFVWLKQDQLALLISGTTCSFPSGLEGGDQGAQGYTHPMAHYITCHVHVPASVLTLYTKLAIGQEKNKGTSITFSLNRQRIFLLI